jgi:hypothetical protein
MEALDVSWFTQLASPTAPRSKSIERLIEEFVSPILEARNPDHLAALVDQQLESRSFEKMTTALTGTKRSQSKEEVDRRAVYLAALGPDCARMVEQIWRLQTAAREASQTADKITPPPLNDVVRLLPRVPTNVSFLTDPKVPPLVAAGALSAQRWLAYACAVVYAAARGERLTAWLAHTVARNWLAALHLHLRLLASLPGISVPEDLVPKSERLDLAKLQAEADATALAIQGAVDSVE